MALLGQRPRPILERAIYADLGPRRSTVYRTRISSFSSGPYVRHFDCVLGFDMVARSKTALNK